MMWQRHKNLRDLAAEADRAVSVLRCPYTRDNFPSSESERLGVSNEYRVLALCLLR
jgi:hypothetical protein